MNGMRSSYDAIPDPQNDTSNIHASLTRSRKYQLFGIVIVIAVLSVIGLTVKSLPTKSGIVFRSHEMLKTQESLGLLKGDNNLKLLFDDFIVKYGKEYEGESEYATRYEIFKKNLAVIDMRNAKERSSGGLATHGVNKFTDYSEEEYASLLKLTIPPRSVSENDDEPEFKATSATFSDWRQTYVTAIKDQGKCGSCWAFTSTEQIESDTLRTLTGFDSSLNLAPQQLVDCDSSDGGCNGGWMEKAWKYVQNAGGMEFRYDYPYTGTKGTCYTDSSKFILGVSSYNGYYNNEAWMQNYVLTTGPLSVCLDADSISSYSSGIITSCPGTSCNHAVQIVGLNAASSPPYWIVGVFVLFLVLCSLFDIF